MRINLFEKLKNSSAAKFLFDLNIGLEKENLRVYKDGRIAQSSHPKRLGSKLNHPYITTDFAEAQLELVTPPRSSIKEAYGFLETLFDLVCEEIPEDEYLWEQSAPPVVDSEDQIQIASYGEGGEEHEKYRAHLAKLYGKKRQLYSGVHYNFSFSDKFLQLLYEIYEDDFPDYTAFKDELYLKVTRQLLRKRWMIIQLLGASPVTHKSLNGGSYCEMGQGSDYEFLNFGTSARTSVCGYRNKEDFVLNYESIEAYHKSIEDLIQAEKISSAKELYTPVRLKFEPGEAHIAYLEIRLLDNFPFSKTGINKNALYGLHMLLIDSLISDEDERFDAQAQEEANSNHNLVASQGRKTELNIRFKGSEVSAQDYLIEFYNSIDQNLVPLIPETKKRDYKKALNRIRTLIERPEERPSARVLKEIQKEGIVKFQMEHAIQSKKEALEKSYKFHGLEDMELSTQLLLKDSLRRGLFFDIIDRGANFIKLWNSNQEQFVQQATKTALDNYASILMMEDKIVTKYVLDKAKIPCPKGENYDDPEQALRDFSFFKGKSIVIKPNSTNFGLGITILKNNQDLEMYKRAVEIAFDHDKTILIEEFISGKEYRVFIINDKVVGILHRVPANVIGDGVHNIAQLVDLKNQNPLRGKGYKTPLEKIAKGEAEAMFLKTQGLDFNSIPEKDQRVYLRENSNISTGGDSIDLTDEVHDSYKRISEQAAKALGVKITGLDIMIDDLKLPAKPGNHSIIELNFNPAIHIHCHPFVGKNRRLNEKILEALGF